MSEDEIYWGEEDFSEGCEDFDLCNEVERSEYLKEEEAWEEWNNDDSC